MMGGSTEPKCYIVRQGDGTLRSLGLALLTRLAHARTIAEASTVSTQPRRHIHLQSGKKPKNMFGVILGPLGSNLNDVIKILAKAFKPLESEEDPFCYCSSHNFQAQPAQDEGAH